MRQAGIIAAAGIIALEEMVDRLAEDHENARHLAEGIAGIRGLSIDLERVQTDIVYFELVSNRLTADELVTELGKKGIKILCVGPRRLRAVTHYGISAEDIDLTVKALGEVMKEA